MNFPPQYVKMMEKSPVQKGHTLQPYDWVADMASLLTIGITIYKESYPGHQPSLIWLPLEHDWWEMIEAENVFIKWRMISSWLVENIKILAVNEEISFLELLCAFVHWEKYGMKWKGEKWVKL